MPPRVKKRGRPRSQSAPAEAPRKQRNSRWQRLLMVASVLRAAKQFGVPQQTLGDRKVVHGTNPGPKPFLTSVEEELLSFLVDVAEAGYGKTRKQIMGLAESVARDKGQMTGLKKDLRWVVLEIYESAATTFPP